MLDAAKPRVADHLREGLLIRKPANGLDEVLVGGAVVRDRGADLWDHFERVALIGGPEHRVRDLTKLETQKAPAGTEHAPRLGERPVNVRHVADAKGDGVHIKGVVLKRQLLCVARHPLHRRRLRGGLVLPLCAQPALLEHRLVDVAHDEARRLRRLCGRRRRCRFLHLLRDAKRNVARAARHVENLQPAAANFLNPNCVHKCILP
mmetsp:Transcript_22630/g.49420  ORF Transcript_22630/g.49420 Transcript_22630/m.49420 type:complete len:206 (-) Transcript_22630:393-1010(-)